MLTKVCDINPWFITGFTDAEGCFTITINRNKKTRLNIKASFQICLHSKDIYLLNQIKHFFNCGIIQNKTTRNQAVFRVDSIADLNNIIIPHFMNYPLISQKAADFNLFAKIVKLMILKTHMTEEGLKK